MATITTPLLLNMFEGDEITVRLENGHFVVTMDHGVATMATDTLEVTACGTREEWRAARGF